MKKGVVKVILEWKQHKNTIRKIIEGGRFITLPVEESTGFYQLSVVALNHVSVCHIKKECVNEIMKNDWEINKIMMDLMSDEFQFPYEKISILNTRNNHGKLASALLYLNREDGGSIPEYVSRKDLAEMACISLESANKILQELKNDRIIDMDKRRITVLQPQLLKVLSNVG